MSNSAKWLISTVCGTAAAFFHKYGIFFLLVAIAIAFDCVTGLLRAKTVGEPITSKRGYVGFGKKMSLLVALLFGIYLDYSIPLLFSHAGMVFDAELPFAVTICCYIVLNEAISICENLYKINPSIMPSWIVGLLRGSKSKFEQRK